jgi:hypothetical protein
VKFGVKEKKKKEPNGEVWGQRKEKERIDGVWVYFV